MKTIADAQAVATASERRPVVQTWDLGKTYRTGFWLNQKVTSLKNCSLTVYQGETFGLLGPNGAGKTTLLKSLLGIVRPTQGRGVLLDRPIGDRTVKQRLGYLPENAYFYDYLTAWEFLEFMGGLFELPTSVVRRRIHELLDMVGLAKRTAQRKHLRKYSKGMLQRVGLAQALINDPEIVFLDEPMSGLDPLGRYQVREIILALKGQGKTIFFNSHVLADVEQICDRVALLARGELICVGSLSEILGTADGYRVVIQGGDEERLKHWLDNLTLQDRYWHGQLTSSPEAFISVLPSMKAQLVSLSLARLSLEEFFLQQLRARGIYTSQ